MTQDFEYVLDVLNAHKELQESIIRDIVRRIVKNAGVVTDTAAWQAECLQQSGILLDDIIKQSANAAKLLPEEIKEAFDDAQTKIFDYDDILIEAAGFEPVEFKAISPEMANIWEAALLKTSTEAVNLTKTTAVTSQAKYIQACDLASMQVSSGAFSYTTAICNAVKSAALQGVSVVYPSGWVDSLDTAIRRSLLTGVNQTAGQLQTMRADELDCDIMELSAHAGARYEHALWQGKLVSRSGKKGYLSLADIGYGDVRGFMGANCRHNWHMFFVGISTPAYTPEQLEKFKNETVTYNGQDIPLWKANDYQRRLERNIKGSKRQLVALDEAIKNTDDDLLKSELKLNFENASVRLKGQEAKLKDFCNQTGILRKPSREQVFATETENGIKNWGRSVSQKAVMANKNFVDNSAKSGIMKIRGGNMNLKIDKFTPCLEDARTGEIVKTSYSLTTNKELKSLKGWKFDWSSPDLENAEVYKLTAEGKDEIQGLVAVTKFERDKAIYVNIAESAPQNTGKNKLYNGVGGHLFAIAAQRSVELGYGGFVFMDAKNRELVSHYEKILGAVLLGRPHQYRMLIDEDAANKLLKIYTFNKEE